MENIAPYILIVILAVCIVAAVAFVKSHILGTLKYDNSGETYRCLFEFDNLDEIEQKKFAIVKIEPANLNLPGERQ